ncbi:endoglucanase [Tumebacillus sp. BK434]|uniref:M42 family metallopeptidase n=1 Tax=Tumebacillus sp. BK434 TaxID=2512169 RepID=UPI0010446376|nr:M42 family peptidase [Tumebacillus sp. BK434]TCP59080.1 endoglucanase [Tumebacillus sp. BK434]
MKELMVTLAQAAGPSGQEENVRALLKAAVAPYADEVREDVVGNLIVTKKGTGASKKHLLVAAHMDEAGLMALHVEAGGRVRVGGIGGLEPEAIVGQRFVFANGTVGTVHADSQEDKELTMIKLYLDLGVSTKEAAEELVRVGDSCARLQETLELAPGRLSGKALDNRVGCAAAVEVLKRIGTPVHDVSVVFTVQHGVGSRGVKTAGYALKPDFALVLDGVNTEHCAAVELGQGPAIKVIDRQAIVPPRIKHFLIEQAEAAGIAYQMEVNPEGTSDTGALLLTEDGIPSGALSIPVKVEANGTETVELHDVELTVQLAVKALAAYSL